MMKEDKLKELIHEFECQKLDHKSKDYFKSKSKEIAKDLSSFMNSEGGFILIGVKENKPDGLKFEQRHEEKIMNICRDCLKPPRSVNFDISQINGNDIVILEIIPSREPIQTNDRYYLRFGSTNREMTHEEIKKKFSEAQKLYKIINEKDAEEIINQIQMIRGKILDKTQREKNYLTFESSSGSILGNSCNIYAKLYESFNVKSKLIFTTLHNVTIEELKKILAQYYKLFSDFSYSTSAFSIVQSGFNWVGFGPKNFIRAITEQKERYKSIIERYGENKHIHHREAAFFIDEIKDGLFFISCEPNYSKYTNNLTMDYFDVGFVLKGIPFNHLFNEFFINIDIEPFTILTNEKQSSFPNDSPFVISKNIGVNKKIFFHADGLIQPFKHINKDNKIWVSGAYGKTPDILKKLELDNEVLVHLRQHHWLEDTVEYNIDRIKYTKFNLGCFPAAVISIDIDW
jgi:hypothetical protein